MLIIVQHSDEPVLNLFLDAVPSEVERCHRDAFSVGHPNAPSRCKQEQLHYNRARESYSHLSVVG